MYARFSFPHSLLDMIATTQAVEKCGTFTAFPAVVGLYVNCQRAPAKLPKTTFSTQAPPPHITSCADFFFNKVLVVVSRDEWMTESRSHRRSLPVTEPHPKCSKLMHPMTAEQQQQDRQKMTRADRLMTGRQRQHRLQVDNCDE